MFFICRKHILTTKVKETACLYQAKILFWVSINYDFLQKSERFQVFMAPVEIYKKWHESLNYWYRYIYSYILNKSTRYKYF